MQVMCKDNTNTVLSKYKIYDVYRVLRKYFVVLIQDGSVQAVSKNKCVVLNIKKFENKFKRIVLRRK